MRGGGGYLRSAAGEVWAEYYVYYKSLYKYVVKFFSKRII